MNKKVTIRVSDEVWCSVIGLSQEHNDTLWHKFGIYVDGYHFMPAYKMRRWDGKVRFFEKTGKTYLRLLDQIVPYLDSWGYDIDLVDSREEKVAPQPVGKLTKFDSTGIAIEAEGGNIIPGAEIREGLEFHLRPYQLQCVNDCIAHGSGFIIAGTGAGKTSITAGISHVYSSIGYRVITIVPSSDLVDQTAEWYRTLGLETGIYSGEEKDINKPNVVATWQALQYNPELMSNFDVLIWDEAHGVKATVGQKLINEYGKHIAFRFGVTGTFPKPEVDQMSLFSSIGPILRTITARWLIDNGYLAKVDIQPVELNETYVDENFPDYDSEKAFLSKSPARMEMIANLIISQAAEHGNTLVLVNSIPFGKKLAALIKDAVFLYGNSAKDIRKEHYEMFESRDDLIVIASSGIASTGISIDRVFCLFLVDAGKSFIKAIQSIGRGLRLGHDKNEIAVVDVHSKQKWAKKHFKERVKHYKEAEYPVLEVIKIKVKG
jgi:superfamily II DNA or RNA helicase